MELKMNNYYFYTVSFDETQVQYAWADQDAFTIHPELRMLQFQPRRPLHYSMAFVPRYNEGNNLLIGLV